MGGRGANGGFCAGETLALSQDLLAVLGWNRAPLQRSGGVWKSRVRLCCRGCVDKIEGAWTLLYHVPTLLLAGHFMLQEMPRFEIPPWPKRSSAVDWREQSQAPRQGVGGSRVGLKPGFCRFAVAGLEGSEVGVSLRRCAVVHGGGLDGSRRLARAIRLLDPPAPLQYCSR